MKATRLALSFATSLLVCAHAYGSPPGGSGKNGPVAHSDRDRGHHRLDSWTFGWLDRGFGIACRGPLGPGCTRRPFPYGYPYPYPYPYPYGIVLPPTGHEYLPDDWPFYLPAHEPALQFPYRRRRPFDLPSLNTCPDGVQRCHEDDPFGSSQDPR